MEQPAQVALPDYPDPVRVEWKLLAQLRTDTPSLHATDLAKRLGFGVNTVRQWLKDPAYQRYENWVIGKNYDALPLSLKKTHADVQEKFLDFAGYMQDRLLELIEGTDDEKLQKEIAQDWLDRAGHSPVRKVLSGSLTLSMTPELFEELERRAKEAGIGRTIDASPASSV